MLNRKQKQEEMPPVEVAETPEEFHSHIKALGQWQAHLEKMEAEMNEALAPVKEAFETKSAPAKQQIEALTAAITTYAENNRAILTKDGALKTVKLPTGNISWKANPLSIVFDRDAADIVTDIMAKGTKAFKALIKTVSTPDKAAMKKDRKTAETIDGVRFVDDEETFKIEPFGAKLAP
ncbi:MAG: host-nuclease inhibitor Gam family protein [Pseudomonadota bacterium]